jgi:hypothetical protein
MRSEFEMKKRRQLIILEAKISLLCLNSTSAMEEPDELKGTPYVVERIGTFAYGGRPVWDPGRKVKIIISAVDRANNIQFLRGG